MKTELNAENVHKTFMDCLFKEGEPTENHIVAQGVMLKVGFHPDRLKEKEQAIAEILSGLSSDFKKSGGGGMTFLNMCNDANGVQWADLHQTMDELVCLGIASKKLSFVMPREMWDMLPGGMPYVVVSE
jgi:hypothetical protein